MSPVSLGSRAWTLINKESNLLITSSVTLSHGKKEEKDSNNMSGNKIEASNKSWDIYSS